MKRLLPLLLAACQATPKSEPEPNADLIMASQVVFDIQKLRHGQWARYTIREQGDPNPKVIRYASVGADADGLWVENRVPGEPNPFVIKSKFSWEGKLLEQWVGEVGSPKPAKVFPREGDKPVETKKGPQPTVSSEISDEKITAVGREYRCTKITTTLTYSNGRTSTLTNWCAPEVPFSLLHEGKSYGGLVKRAFGRYSMELANYGEDAQPELVIPK